MHLLSPTGLHYPITIAKLCKQPNEPLKRRDALFEYSYSTKVEEGNRYGEVAQVDKAFFSTFESSLEGTLVNWKISVGSVVKGPHTPLADAEEECTHSVQYGGMCVNCGKDLTTMDYTAAAPETARASTTVTPNHQALRISDEEAARSDEEAKTRLLGRRKLSLVVDLDLTIIHASVDPTIREWMDDGKNPNHPAVRDVRVFDLYDEALQRNVSYYIKLRPNLHNFLHTVSRLYELYIYTMGTRAYAENIAQLIDPDRKLFGERILSRTETPGEVSKNLRKLFPVDNRMVVIIDDRADVWNWSNYLVRVQPFNFFVGIGDINSSFLPKQEEPPKVIADPQIATQVTNHMSDQLDEVESVAESKENDTGSIQMQRSLASSSSASRDSPADRSDGDESALGQLVSMQENTDASDIQRKTAEQDEKLAAQLNERPLLKLQKNLEKQEEKAAAADLAVSNSEDETKQDGESPGAATERPRSVSRAPEPQTLLKDDDAELYRIEDVLVKIQRNFFNMFDERVEEDEQRTPAPRLIPDVKDVIEQYRTLPLKGCGVVFTRLVPLDMDVMKTRWADMAMRLGAVVQTDLRENTTHVICKPGDPTSKMREAAHKNVKRRARGKPEINIVSSDWLWDSVAQWWHRVNESHYAIPVEPAMRKKRGSETMGENYFSDTLGESGGASEDERENKNKLQIDTNWQTAGDDSEDEAKEAKSPEEEAAEWEEAFELGDEDMSESESEDGNSIQDGSVGSVAKVNGISRSARKRRRDEESERGSESEASSGASSLKSLRVADDGHGSQLQRRKRRALERTSSLTRVSNAHTVPVHSQGEEDDDGLEAAMREALGETETGEVDEETE